MLFSHSFSCKMAVELQKVSVLLLFFNSVAASYWNNEFVIGKLPFQVLRKVVHPSKEKHENTRLVTTPKRCDADFSSYIRLLMNEGWPFSGHERVTEARLPLRPLV